ncbi:scavenger mRNA-decapping enzyme DcpS-like protein [Euroglyphus maynei]|uniref:m7GpppX diphosphatase n=1 Tax=Euroglyphus maynei TaxID=6958 RepID=A0A1Y3BUI4_EURMA|nr:scavenger mRNA-decapping enzyme DcpS-like protein [Euroglyphus maynei]
MTQSVHEVLLKRFGPNQPNQGSVLADFKFERVLRIDSKRKLVRTQDNNMMIIKIQIQHSRVLKRGTNLFRNDIYGTYLVNLMLDDSEHDALLNKIFMTVIHPASPNDIDKFIDHPHRMIAETADLYDRITKPYIEQQVSKPGHLQWLYNVLEGKAETDRVIHSDQDFVLANDMKWNCENDNHLSELEKQSIYLNALVRRRDLRSLRDLNGQHLPLLEAIYERGRQAISKRYAIPVDQLRVFIHYQPSFYHVHVHFTHLLNEQRGFQCERAHLLSTVIQNIRLMNDYYQRVTLHFPLSDASMLKFN